MDTSALVARLIATQPLPVLDFGSKPVRPEYLRLIDKTPSAQWSATHTSFDLLCDACERRAAQEHGYGVSLHTFDGRDTEADLCAEYIDAVMYALRLFMETGLLMDYEGLQDAIWVACRAIGRAELRSRVTDHNAARPSGVINGR